MRTIVATLILLTGCASVPEEKEASDSGHVLDVASMSIYCAARGKILALVGVDLEGNIQAGACSDPPPEFRGRSS